MLSPENALLVIVDVQGKLAQLMHDRETFFRNLQIAIRGAQILELPILWLEQNPAGLGATTPEIAALLANDTPIPKMSFSACGEAAFRQALQARRRRQILLAGLEAHVCIYLTALELLAQGYEVQVIADAVASRRAQNKQVGLARMERLGAGITCTETVLFELLGRAEGPRFKDIVKLLR